MLPFPSHVVGCLSLYPSPLSFRQGGVGASLPSSPGPFLIQGVNHPFLFPFGENVGEAASVFSPCFFWGFQCDDLGDRSLLTGSGAAQQPVTRVEQLEVHSAFYLFG